ncbi:unnamed protein product [marine sediment metagenome]|uniref:Uncharacterized protein n=1 Tax=marine sediment metagenome TaxID=412755 RepID=X1HSY9_9ZZZZ
MKDICMEKLNPLFTTTRAVFTIPLGTWQTRMGKLTNEEAGKIKDAVAHTQTIAKIELKGPSDLPLAQIYDGLKDRLEDIVKVGELASWDMGAPKLNWQGIIDDTKCYMEEWLLDEACKCECKQ